MSKILFFGVGMSNIEAVLLSDGVWHNVIGSSFRRFAEGLVAFDEQVTITRDAVTIVGEESVKGIRVAPRE